MKCSMEALCSSSQTLQTQTHQLNVIAVVFEVKLEPTSEEASFLMKLFIHWNTFSSKPETQPMI